MNIYPPGSRIGQYEVVSKPMMGGMGVVYFCLDHEHDGRPVALKTFRPEFLPDRAARDRFLREGTAWVELGNHPHIVRCHGVRYIDPIIFLILELIATEQYHDNASLRSWMGMPMPLDQSILFALQIARGMKHATEKIFGFVHRDLKPENVLVGADNMPNASVNRLRVTDFGLASILNVEIADLKNDSGSEYLGRTQITHGIVGTPLYMAPEQWNGETVGIYTDVYAMGCILYEMLTAQRAVSGRNASELRSAHCAGKLSILPKNLPREIKVLIERCLALHTRERYQTWGEVAYELEQVYSALIGRMAPNEFEGEQIDRDERAQEGWSYNAIGQAYSHMGKVNIAKDYFEKSLSIAREIGDQREEGDILGNLGVVNSSLGEVRQAIGYHEQHLKISQNLGHQRGECAALGNLGLSYSSLGESQKAIGYLEQGLAIARNLGDHSLEGAHLNHLGNEYKKLGEMQRAIKYHEEALTMARDIGDHRMEGNALGNLGNAYEAIGSAKQALGYYQQQVEITRGIGDREGESNAIGNLGVAYKDLGEMERAIHLYEQSLTIKREIGDRSGESNFLNWLGNAYADIGSKQQAIDYYEKALAIQREIGNQSLVGDFLGNIGLVYAELGNTQQAIKYYEQAIITGRDNRNPANVAIDALNLALLYAKQGDPRALPLVQEAAHTFENIGSPHIRAAELLIDQLQGNIPMRSNPTDATLEAAYESFQHASSPQAMQLVLEKYPFIADDKFIQAIEQAIKKAHPDFMILEQRLTLLREITGKQKPGFWDRLIGKK